MAVFLFPIFLLIFLSVHAIYWLEMNFSGNCLRHLSEQVWLPIAAQAFLKYIFSSLPYKYNTGDINIPYKEKKVKLY